MRIFTLVADCKRTVIACLVLLCGLMMSEVGWGQTTQTFNASGSWFCPAGVTSITVECWGAGGSGGKRTSNGVAGGGGGGAYSMKVIPVSAGTTYTYTVGTGSNSTSPGGDSWFQSDATVMAKGGNSVADNSATRATGGAAASSIGTVRNNGGDGRNGNTTGTDYGGGGGSSAGVGIDGSDATDQNGATAPAGGGNGGNGRYNTQGDGLAGNIPGGGGGGALRTSSGTRNGGTGANGQIKITYTQLTYKSQINSINYGTSPWCAGKTRSVTVSITNVGTATWTDATPDINIGLKWDADPDYGSPPGNISRQNAGNLAPGATGTYIFPIVTPVIASGTDHLTADVVYEAISWFADNGGGVGPGNVKFVTPGITILAAPAAPTGFSSQSFCANANPTVADLLASGSNIQWYATASGGTTLATTTALVNGTHYYASQTNGSGCESSSRLDVVANIYTTLTGLSYSVTPAVYCTGAAIIGNNPTVTGGSATSYSISPALPAGLILNTNTGAITGIPTVVASAGDYVVTATNLCGSVQTTINITVIQGVSGLNYSATPVSYCVGNAITPNAVTGISGDGTITYSVSPALPAGLSINTNTGTITGTPTTASAATNYTVTASNGCSNTTRVLNITVLASVTSLSYTVQNPTYCTGNAITTNSPTSNGGGTKTYSISPALPSGLNFSTTTGAITGTPTAVAATAAYVVTVSNGCSSAQTTLNLTVLQGLSGLSYAATPVTYCTNFAITPNTVAGITGGGTITYSVSPALPAGLSISSSTGAISGTPTAASTAANYTITASNGCSNTTAVVNITVLSSVTSLSYTVQNPTYCTGNAIATNSPTSNGSGTKTYSISPALPSGLNFSTTTGAITGTPTAVAATAVYVVTVSNGCSSAQTTLNLTVLQGLSGLNYSATPVSYCVGNAITPNTVTGISGDGTITYSVSPALPAGLSINTNTGTITGTPTTASGATNYTVTASNGCSNTTRVLNITVLASVTSLTYTVQNPTYCTGNAIATNSPTSNGGGSKTYSISPALPSGLNFSSTTGAITGTPTAAAATAAYVVTVSNGCSSAQTTLNITVFQSLSGLNYSATPVSYCVSNAITPNTVTGISGDGTITYSVSPALPAGLSINTNTGTITGTPTTASGATNYTVTASNGCSNTTRVLNITVLASVTSLSYTVQNPTYCTGNAITTNSPTSNGGGTKTYSISPALPSGLNFSTTTGAITGTPTAAAATAAYVVTVSNGCSSAQTTLNLTVLQGLSGLNYSATPVSYCVGSPITPNIVASIIGGGTITYSVSPALPTGLSINSGTGTISGTPTVVQAAANYTVTAANGCSNTTKVLNITINALPTPALTASKDPACMNENVTYTTDAGQSNYVWTFSGTSGINYTIISGGNSTSNVTVVSWHTAGIQTVTVNYNNSNGCAAPTATSKNITVLSIPTGTFSASETSGNAPDDNIICTGDPVTFTAPSGYGSYIFKVGATVVQTGTSNTYTPFSLANGASVTVDVANASNCGVTFGPIVITVHPKPTPTLSADKSSICPGGTITFTAGGGTNYNFIVDGAPVQSSSSPTFLYSNLIPGTYSVSVEVTNTDGCTATSSPVTVTVNTLPSGTITVTENSGTSSTDKKVCVGDPVTFTATAGYDVYTFIVNGIPVATGSSNVYTTSFASGPTATVKVDVTNSSTGCTATFPQQVITVASLPTGSLTASENSGIPNNNEICAGATVNFAASAGFTTYKFYVNGAGAPIITGTRFYSSSSLSNGDYVTVEVTNSNGCVATFTSSSITVVPAPSGALSASTTEICPGEEIEFTATVGFANYDFKRNGVSFANGSSNTASYTGFANGDVVTVDVTNASSCSGVFNSLTITVNLLPAGTLVPVENSGTANNDGIICTDANVVFTATPGYSNYDFKLNGTTVQYGPSNTYNNTALADGNVVTVEVTSSKGCVASFNDVTIVVHPLPSVALITGDASVCDGSTITLANTTADGVWSSSNTGIATIDASGVVTGIAAGTVTISYTVTSGFGCGTTVTKDITVNAVPVVANINGPNKVCVGDSKILTNATTGGVWASSDPGIVTVDGSGTITGVSAGTATISYSVTNTDNCTTVKTKLITVNDLPVVDVITGTMNVCEDNTTQLANTTAGGVWSSDNNFVATVSNSGLVTGKNPGNAVISYTVTDANNCNTTVTVTVTVNALPIPTLSGANPICPGATETYTTEAGQLNYIWTYTGGTKIAGGSTSDNTITITWDQPGARTIYVNYTDANGCSGANSATLTTSTGTVPVISGPRPVCEGSAGNTYSTQPGYSGYVWAITGGTITSGGGSNDATATVTWTSAGTQSISVNFTDNNGCTPAAPTVYNVNVRKLPTATIIGTTEVCQDDATPLITFTGANATAPYTFTYTINGGSPQTITTSTGNSVTLPVPTGTPGIFTYDLISVQESSTTTCSQLQTGSVTVTVNALPTATITGATEVCKDGSNPVITFTGANGTVPYTFTYNINGGAPQTVVSDGTGIATVAAPTNVSGTFIYNLVSVKDGSATTCSQVQAGSATVKVNPLPTATINGTTSVCINSASPDITFTGSGGTAPYTFTYDINGGTPLIAVSNLAGVAAVPVLTTVAGTYTYNLISVKDATATLCSQNQTGSATVTVTPASVGGSVTSDAIACSGSNTGILNLSGNIGNVIRWESSTDNFTTIATIANTTTNYTYNNLTVTTKFRAVVQSGNCSSANSVAATITVNPVSVGGTVGTSTSVCSGSNSGTLSLTGQTGSVIRWESSTDNFATITTIANTTVNYTYNNLTQTTKFRAVVQNNPCSSANSVAATITVNLLPTATISGTASVCQNATAPLITFTGANGTAPYTFIYKVNGGSNQTVVSTGNTATVSQPTGTVNTYTYTLVSVSDNKGCSQSQSGSAVITVNAPPPAFVLTPTSATICEGSVQPLSASDGVVTSGSLTFNSTNNNLAIPDPSGSTPGSRTSAITVSGIPAEAVISSVSVKFNATHGYDQDLSFNLKAPNSKVLNLVNRRGGSSNNFTNTIISSNSTNPISAGTAPFTNTYSADAANNVGYPDASNVTAFSSLFNTPNGTWTLETADHLGCHGGTLACLLGGGDYYTGTLNNWSITINYTTPTLPLNVAWSPVADLYTDAGATVAYTGTNLSTVYTKPSTPGAKTYTATVTNSDGCSTSQNVIVNVNPKPVVTATADYCLVAGKVQLTANSTPAADSYIWSTGETTQTILVDEAGDYTVTAFSAGCSGSTTINVANELVVNGDFEAGDGGFTTLYGSRTGSFYVYSNPATGLWPEGDYAVDTSAYSPSSNIGYHPNFHGKDHTTGHGKFMMINGSVALKTIWEQTVNVLPNTTYYFSAWGMNLNPASPAQLSFTINGKQRGSVADLDLAAKPTTESQVGLSNWVRFYGTWTAESNVTSAVISIVNLNLTPGGNDFGLDDISFSTLSTFINLESAPGTDAQTPCLNTPIIPIVYSAGSSGTIPDITGLPDGVTASWNGVLLTISGTPTVAGNYPYIVSTTGNCQPFTATGFINVQKQTIALSSGSATQPVCINAAITPIVFAIGGSGTGATVTGLPAGVTGSYDAGTKKFTISGTPNVAGTFNYTVNTTGTCTAASATGTITVNQQAIALASANAIQTVCADQDIDPIIYDLSGTATGASVSGLPAGVTGEVQGTSFIISGAPTAAPGTYNYTVTTTGTCTPAATATGFITVKPSVSISLVTPGTDDQTLCINASLSDIEYTLGGTALSASITSGSLPTGVNAALTGGIFKISGTPTVAGVYNYTITAEGECSDITISGKITVQKQTIALTSGSASPTLCLNSTLTSPIVFTVGTTSTGAHIAWSPSPPAGISGTYSGGVFTISSSGPVTALGTFDYTVTTEGTCGPVASFSGKITVTGTVGGTVTAAQSFLCSGSSVFINLTGHTGNILHWERSDDGGAWMNIASTSSTLNATNIIVPTQFRVLVKSGSCDPAYSSIVTVGVRYYWTGITDRDWNKALNWSNSEIPSNSCDMITIPAGPVNQPRLMGNITVPSITIMPGASVDLNGNTLTVNGSFVGTGKLKGSATSGLTIATPGDAGTVYFDPASPYNQLKTLTVNSGATLTLGGNVAAGDTLNIVAGNSATGLGTVTANGNLNANGILTLKSDNQGTARVGISAGKIDGDVTVERFIPPLRAWRLLTVPFSSSTQLVRDAWQEGVNNFGLDYSTFNKNPHPGYGTHITGNNNTSLGFDYNTTQNPSYKVWDPVANTWSATEPPTNSTVITAFNGAYCVFVRGSRAVDLSLGTGAPSSPTVLRAKGVLNQTGLTATKTISGSPGKFVLMGNPYASTINVLDIISRPATTGIVSDKFWVWDPKITGSGTDNVGAFVSYKAGVIAPNNSPTYPDVDAIKKLQSGQAFMVQLTGTSSAANMDFRESDKLDESRNVFGLRAAKPQGTTDPVIYTNLMEGTGKNIGLVDGVAASFNNRYAEKVDADDADKLWNFDENISLQRDGKSLAIEFRPLVNKKDTLFYNLSIKQQPYTLKIFAANLADPSTTEAWLVDKFLKTKISLNLADTTLYSFTPTKNAKSYTGRFMLVFKNLKKSKKNNGGNTAESIVAKTLESSVIVYPNPASTNKVSLEFTNMDKGSYEVVVYSGQGQKLATRKIVHNGGTAAHVLPLDASWAGGVYRINIIHEDSGKAVNLNLVISR